MELVVKIMLFSSQMLILAVFMRALLSWFKPDPNSKAVRLLVTLTDPILKPIRKVIPSFSGIDVSPIIALFALSYLGEYLATFITQPAL